jgi:pyridoxal phosphate enzyme (YggS family)
LILELLQEDIVEAERRIAAARERGGQGQAVRLLAATKYVGVADMKVLLEAGVRLVGENRADELEAKWKAYGEAFEYHFIGHLQRRKARRVLPRVTMIQSVESLDLVRELQARTTDPVNVMLEVNISGEESKYGILPADAEAFLERAAPFDAVHFAGFMTMAPLVPDPEEARPVFRQLRELRDRLAPLFAPRYDLADLSMGMSNDFEVAVEEGATLVRLGSTLFSRAQGGRGDGRG